MASISSPARSLYLIYTLVLLHFSVLSVGLQVTPGSKCASYCLDDPNENPSDPNASNTNSTDVVCLNEDYWATSKGTKFRKCVDCLQTSTVVNGSENDVAWHLYNLRYTVDVCLFSYPRADEESTSHSSPCVQAETCQPLRAALETGNLDPNNGTEYDYCFADDGAFGGTALDSCVECLRTTSNQTYIANFLTALEAGCKQKPMTGVVLGLSGTLFTSSIVNITGSSTEQSGTGSGSPKSSLSTGTIVGVAIGALILLLSAVGLFFIYWRRQHNQPQFHFSDGFYPRDGRPIKSISSSITGGYIPHYTVDYKRPPGTDHQRNYEMHDSIKTQHVVIPSRKVYASDFPETATAGLWGRDTPLQQQQFLPSSQVVSPLANQVTFDNTSSKGLDEMPTHPAFIPRAFTRGSRNPSAFAEEEERAPKSNRPDDFAVHQYLDTIDDVSTIDVKSLISPPLPTANTTKSMNTIKTSTSLLSNPFSTAQSSPKNAPSPPPKSPPTRGGSPAITPNLSLPSFSRVRSPKKYVPPPINIDLAKPKAQRLPDPDAESGML